MVMRVGVQPSSAPFERIDHSLYVKFAIGK